MDANNCAALRAISDRLAEWQRKQVAVGEESLTDWLLFEMSSQLSSFRYLKFTRHREARETGADWEWWILFDGGCFGSRVQAKRVRIGIDNYSGLAYTNRHGLQITMLREAAKANGLPAFYLFYAPGDCGASLLCPREPYASLGGAFISSASRLYDRFILPGPSSISAAQLLAESNPLHCLFCCPLVTFGDEDGWRRHVQKYFPQESSADGGDGPQGFRREPPEYVYRLLTNDLAADAALSDQIAELPPVQGIAVFDARGA